MEKYTISLIDGYFIEVDELNHTLKQIYAGKDKQGNTKTCEKTIGYCSSVADCLRVLLERKLVDENDGEVLSIAEYVGKVRGLFERIKQLDIVEK